MKDKISTLFKNKITYDLSFEKIKNKIDYSLVGESKQRKQKRIYKFAISMASFIIVLFSSLSLALINNSPYENQVPAKYLKVLNSNDFIYHLGPQCPFYLTFESVLDTQYHPKWPKNFYKVQTEKLDDFYTCGYIPNEEFNKYYENYSKYTNMEEHLFTSEFFGFYTAAVRNKLIEYDVIWREYDDPNDIENYLGDNYTLAIILRSRDVNIITNESTQTKIDLNKRLYINVAYWYKNSKITVWEGHKENNLLYMNGTFVWLLSIPAVENDYAAFPFSTIDFINYFNEIVNIDEKEAIILYNHGIDFEDESNKKYYTSYYDVIKEAQIDYKKDENDQKYYFDYQVLSEIMYKNN